MNPQNPYNFNPMGQTPMFPNQNYNPFNQDNPIAMLESRIKTLEDKVTEIEKKLNISNTSSNMDGYNPYMSSMHMM